MEMKFFDPLGRRCDAEAFNEWYERSDLHTVRKYESDKLKVVLKYNPVPQDTFGEPKVFSLEIQTKQADGTWNIDLVASDQHWRHIQDAIDGYILVLSERGCVKNEGGISTIVDNKLPPTTHELEFDIVDDAEEELDESGTEFEMPKITAPDALEQPMETTRVGESFGKMTDGNDAW